MANLILKPSTGGVLKLQNDAGTVDALSVSTGGNLTAAGTLGVTGNTTLSGTANNLGTVTAGTLANTVTYPTGTVIKTTFDLTSVRTTLSGGGGTGVVSVLWNDIAVTKLLSTTDLICHAAMTGKSGSNGYGAWFMRAGSNSWIEVGGAHMYIGTNILGFPLLGKIPAADTSAGSNTIDIGWATNTGIVFSVWNPDSSDHSEMTGGTASAITIQEIMV